MSFLDPELSIRSELFVYLEQNASLIRVNVSGFKATLDDLFDNGWKIELIEYSIESQEPQFVLLNPSGISITFRFDRPLSSFSGAHQIVKFMEFTGFGFRAPTPLEFKQKMKVENDEEQLIFLEKILEYQTRHDKKEAQIETSKAKAA